MSSDKEGPLAYLESTYVDLVTGPTVDIYVGPEKRLFNPHKAILCHKSPYFDKCFNGSFREGLEQSVTLDDVDAVTFGLLIEYLYTRRIPLEITCNGYDHDGCKLKVATAFSQLLYFIKLADRLLISTTNEASETMKQLSLNQHIDAINDTHLEDIVQLPVHHYARQTFIQILLLLIVKRYSTKYPDETSGNSTMFDKVAAKFSQELSLELLHAFKPGNTDKYEIRDPIDGKMKWIR